MKRKIFVALFSLLSLLVVFSACDFSLPTADVSSSASKSNIFVDNFTTSTSLDIQINKVNDDTLAEIDKLKEQNNIDSYINIKEVLKRIKLSIVEVYTSSLDGTRQSFSGVVIGTGDYTNSENKVVKISYIATCHHTVNNANEVIVKTADGVSFKEIILIGSDPESDICVLAVLGELTPVEFYNDSDKLEAGESVIAFGNPFGTLGGTATRGILSSSATATEINDKPIVLLQTDTAVSKGNTGGGLFTETGFFIGMVNTSYSEFFNSINDIAFATPSNTVESISKQLITTRTDTTPGYIAGKYILGCVVETVYENRWGTKTYIQISSLDSLGSALKAGLRVGDIINSIEYKDVVTQMTTQNMFVEFTESTVFNIDEKLTFNITRDGTKMDVEVTIQQYIYGES